MRSRGRGATAPAPYKGLDRRGAAAPKTDLNHRLFLAGGLGLLALLLALAALGRYSPLEQVIDVATASVMLGAATVALGALLGVLLLLRHRLTGDAVALWTASAVVVFSGFGIGAAQLVPLLPAVALDPTVIAWVRPAGLLVTGALLLWTLRVPEVDTSLRPGWLLLGALGAVMSVTFVLQLIPGLSRVLVSQLPALPAAEGLAVGPGIAMVWIAMAGVYLWLGYRRHRALLAWLGLMVYALGVAELSSAAAAIYGETWLIGAGTLRMAGLSFGLVGVFRELKLSYFAQNDRLLKVHIDALAGQARMEAQLAEQAERAHEARNALTAIEGATLTLERNREALDPDLRATLAAAVTTEIARLQQLVSAERAEGSVSEFDLRQVIDEQLALVRSGGGKALADLPERLTAVGRAADTAEALQNLLVNARKYAPNSPVLVRARSEGEHVVVRVEDRGPGIAQADRERIFARGERASDGHGDGLGLYVASQLLREQSGRLWLEHSQPGSGATFAFALPAAVPAFAAGEGPSSSATSAASAGPAASAASAAGEVEDDVSDVGQPREVEGQPVTARLDGSGTRASGLGRQAHDRLGDDARR